ncbi:hypothetical protein V8B97DRAFT_1913462 [Scleroderma yunnanense]
MSYVSKTRTCRPVRQTASTTSHHGSGGCGGVYAFASSAGDNGMTLHLFTCHGTVKLRVPYTRRSKEHRDSEYWTARTFQIRYLSTVTYCPILMAVIHTLEFGWYPGCIRQHSQWGAGGQRITPNVDSQFTGPAHLQYPSEVGNDT